PPAGDSDSDGLIAGQLMAEPALFGPQVANVVGIRRGRQAAPGDDLQSVPAESTVLGRVVRDQTQPADAQVGADLRTPAVGAGIDGEALPGVGVDRVESLLLQRIRPDLVRQPDATPFVPAQIDDAPATFPCDLR